MNIGKPKRVVEVQEPAVPYKGEPVESPQKVPAKVPAKT